MAASIISCAMLGAATLICEISLIAPMAPTLSIIQAAFSVSKRACSIFIRALAIMSRLPPRLLKVCGRQYGWRHVCTAFLAPTQPCLLSACSDEYGLGLNDLGQFQSHDRDRQLSCL